MHTHKIQNVNKSKHNTAEGRLLKADQKPMYYSQSVTYSTFVNDSKIKL